RVCSLNGSRSQVQFLLREAFAWRLDCCLARAPVLFVLSALPRVAAFDFGGVGSRHRDLDGPLGAERSVRFRMHRQNAEARIRGGLAGPRGGLWWLAYLWWSRTDRPQSRRRRSRSN